MDNRLAGLIIVILTLAFLWLYDTGRYQAIVQVIKGVPSSSLTGAIGQSNYPGSNINYGLGYGNNALSQLYYGYQLYQQFSGGGTNYNPNIGYYDPGIYVPDGGGDNSGNLANDLSSIFGQII